MKVKLVTGLVVGMTAPSLLGVLASASVLAAVGATPPAGGSGGPGGVSSVPPSMLRLYVEASGSCPGMSWQVLAAVGTVESANGTADLAGVRSGSNSSGAQGPMQFEPATFQSFARPVPPGGADPPSPYDPVDAVYAASRMLCANGAGRPATLVPALYAYNHSLRYVSDVLAAARVLGMGQVPSGPAGAIALRYALSQVGTPYRWGGESAGVGFDCSGLSQAAYSAAGVSIPRVAEQQYLAGPRLPAGAPPAPGDLVFFGPAPGDATHVGLVVDPAGVMVDAPHTGAAVRVERFDPRPGASWGSDLYLGATAPG